MHAEPPEQLKSTPFNHSVIHFVNVRKRLRERERERERENDSDTPLRNKKAFPFFLIPEN